MGRNSIKLPRLELYSAGEGGYFESEKCSAANLCNGAKLGCGMSN